MAGNQFGLLLHGALHGQWGIVDRESLGARKNAGSGARARSIPLSNTKSTTKDLIKTFNP